MLDFGGGLVIFWGTDDALNGVGEHKVGCLVGGQKITDECAAVNGEDEDLFCSVEVGQHLVYVALRLDGQSI